MSKLLGHPVCREKNVHLQHKTLLYVAAERGDAEAARIIIAAGADPNLR